MKQTSVLYWLYMLSLAVLLTILKLKEFPAQEPIQPQAVYVHEGLAQYVSNKWSIEYNQAQKIIDVSEAYGRYSFPSMYDILAIIAIESGFNEKAVSSAHAKGLMQVLYKPTSFDVYTNILDGTLLLRETYELTKDIRVTVQSYNVGLTAYKSGSRNQKYLNKFLTERENLKNADLLWRTQAERNI